MRLILSLLLVFLANPAWAASPPTANGYGARDEPRDLDPRALAELFCEARVAGDMTPLEAHLAPKLVALLDKAAGEVPWQSYPDRAASCAFEIVNGFDDTVGVLVRITYAAPGKTWSDILNLERAPGTWLINNVFYEGGGNLRFRLFQN